VRKLWCAGAIASGMLLLGAAPAWADDTPAADVIRTVPFAGLPMQVARTAQLMPDDGASPLLPPPAALSGQDDSRDPADSQDPATSGNPAGSEDPSTSGIPGASENPATSEEPFTAPDPDGPVAPTAAPTAGIASVSAPPPADTPAAAAPAPAKPAAAPTTPAAPAAAAPAFAAEQKPKTPLLPALDDPRLLEEPVDGFVNREKWKR
jgi:hypothetical protein